MQLDTRHYRGSLPATTLLENARRASLSSYFVSPQGENITTSIHTFTVHTVRVCFKLAMFFKKN